MSIPSQEWYVAQREAGGVEGLSPFALTLRHLTWDEKPPGAVTFSEETWSLTVSGLPKN